MVVARVRANPHPVGVPAGVWVVRNSSKAPAVLRLPPRRQPGCFRIRPIEPASPHQGCIRPPEHSCLRGLRKSKRIFRLAKALGATVGKPVSYGLLGRLVGASCAMHRPSFMVIYLPPLADAIRCVLYSAAFGCRPLRFVGSASGEAEPAVLLALAFFPKMSAMVSRRS